MSSDIKYLGENSLDVIFNNIENHYKHKTNKVITLNATTNSIDLDLGEAFSKTITKNTTLKINSPSSLITYEEFSFTLYLVNNGSYTVTWPSSIKWPGGTAPTLGAISTNVFTFTTINRGSTWYCTNMVLDLK